MNKPEILEAATAALIVLPLLAAGRSKRPFGYRNRKEVHPITWRN
jgi:hypothetical protein